jgi:hypothetical protein
MRPSAPVTVAAQMNEALFSPFQRREIEVRLTSSFQRDDRLGSYIESLVRIGPSGVVLKKGQNGCGTASLEVLTSARALEQGPRDPVTIDSHVTEVEACGKTEDAILRNGVVIVLRSGIPTPGPYEMRVALRNVVSGQDPPSFPERSTTLIPRGGLEPLPLGSATAFVEVPDLQKLNLALSGIRLAGEAAAQALDKEPRADFFYRPPLEGDPAIRSFRAGETIRYKLRQFGDCSPCTRLLTVFRDGILLTEEPLGQASGIFEGTYRLKADAAPGQYMMQVSITRPRDKKRQVNESRSIDFSVDR